MFIKSIVGYCDVLRDVKPKRERIRMLEQELEQSAEILQKLNSERIEIEANLESLQQSYSDRTNEKEGLREQLKELDLRLVSTHSIFISVSSKQTDWISDECVESFHGLG